MCESYKLDTENVETGDVCAFKTKFGGRNISKCKRKLGKFASTVCFKNTMLWTNTLLEHVRASYWQRTSVPLNALHGTTEIEYSSTKTCGSLFFFILFSLAVYFV